jgi:hypothetical protein
MADNTTNQTDSTKPEPKWKKLGNGVQVKERFDKAIEEKLDDLIAQARSGNWKHKQNNERNKSKSRWSPMANNELRLPDVLAERTRGAKMCRRPSTHRSDSEERAQLVTAR